MTGDDTFPHRAMSSSRQRWRISPRRQRVVTPEAMIHHFAVSGEIPHFRG